MGGVHFIHISHNGITLVVATKTNTNAALMFTFLYKVVAVCKAYFGDFDENHVRKNFVLIYEILDEIMDFGFPQIVEPDLLKLYIT
jgi:AP-2 complex subunit mu-1